MSTPNTEPDAQAVPAYTPRPGLERTLVFVVAFLGLAILAGLAAVVLRIIYLSSRPAPQAAPLPAAVAAPSAATALPEGLSLSLPQGAAVRSMSLDGDRVAVYYQAPAGDGIIVMDVKSGAIVGRIAFTGTTAGQ
ncbi:MAG: hypothetical protein WC807_00850 [Hyphomicrobium sp.]|jgi:hypothetical protein